MPLPKPQAIFDRDFEWSELAGFVAEVTPYPTLGVISGRRRQGKSFLLDALCRSTDGFYFAATEGTEAESLRQLGAKIANYRGDQLPYQLASWDEAIPLLLRLASQQPIPVVIDEFPFLVKASSALPSIIQRELGPQAKPSTSPARLLLCGSALSFMGSLLSGSAPLRGRAGLELMVSTFDYRLAARFWEFTDPKLALLNNAIVGGTPAYRREYARDDTPADLDDFSSWVTRTVLNPARPLFREARYLLAEEPRLQDHALYHTLLAAIAAGNRTRGKIANYLDRKSTDLAHPLTLLEDVGLITREVDIFHSNRSNYRIAEPLVTFYHAIMRPEWGALERPGRAAEVWHRSEARFLSQVVGPHFEELCRQWARWFASAESFSGHPHQVGRGTVADPARKTNYEVDVVVVGAEQEGRQRVLSIGEAKWNQVIGIPHLERLQHIKELLQNHPTLDASHARLACYSGAGFTSELRMVAAAGEVQLVDLARLYNDD
ncbi:MAG: ATP-binding protein [Candidatus Dormibacteraceae bacterium]